MIPLNLIDYETYPKIRILLEFRGSLTGEGFQPCIRFQAMVLIQQFSAMMVNRIGIQL